MKNTSWLRLKLLEVDYGAIMEYNKCQVIAFLRVPKGRPISIMIGPELLTGYGRLHGNEMSQLGRTTVCEIRLQWRAVPSVL